MEGGREDGRTRGGNRNSIHREGVKDGRPGIRPRTAAGFGAREPGAEQGGQQRACGRLSGADRWGLGALVLLCVLSVAVWIPLAEAVGGMVGMVLPYMLFRPWQWGRVVGWFWYILSSVSGLWVADFEGTDVWPVIAKAVAVGLYMAMDTRERGRRPNSEGPDGGGRSPVQSKSRGHSRVADGVSGGTRWRWGRWVGLAVGVSVTIAVWGYGVRAGRQQAEASFGAGLCATLEAKGRNLVVAWDRFDAAYAAALLIVETATREAERGWPDMSDLIRATGVDSVAYVQAFDHGRMDAAAVAAADAVVDNDRPAADRAMADAKAVILDALEAVGGRATRERGAAHLDEATALAVRSTFKAPEADRARRTAEAARVDYNATLVEALTAHFAAGPGCGCDPWDRAVAASDGATAPDPAIGEGMVEAARLCFGTAPK